MEPTVVPEIYAACRSIGEVLDKYTTDNRITQAEAVRRYNSIALEMGFPALKTDMPWSNWKNHNSFPSHQKRKGSIQVLSKLLDVPETWFTSLVVRTKALYQAPITPGKSKVKDPHLLDTDKFGCVPHQLKRQTEHALASLSKPEKQIFLLEYVVFLMGLYTQEQQREQSMFTPHQKLKELLHLEIFRVANLNGIAGDNQNQFDFGINILAEELMVDVRIIQDLYDNPESIREPLHINSRYALHALSVTLRKPGQQYAHMPSFGNFELLWAYITDTPPKPSMPEEYRQGSDTDPEGDEPSGHLAFAS